MVMMIDCSVKNKEDHDERDNFFYNDSARQVITTIIEKAHVIRLTADDLVLDPNNDIFVMDYFYNKFFHDQVSVTNVNRHELSFYRSVYRHSKSQHPINIEYTPKYFLDYYERIVAVYANFYEDVEIVWITNGQIEGDITKPLSNNIMPSYTIQDNILKIIGVKPRHARFKDIPHFIKINEINFNGKSGDNFLHIFFDRFNEHIVPKDLNIELTKDMDIDELRSHLTLISMSII